MSKCLIIIDHSFRTNSLLFYKALNSYSNVCVVHVSNYYLDEKFKNYYKNEQQRLLLQSH